MSTGVQVNGEHYNTLHQSIIRLLIMRNCEAIG